jgi:hypothetical protein
VTSLRRAPARTSLRRLDREPQHLLALPAHDAFVTPRSAAIRGQPVEPLRLGVAYPKHVTFANVELAVGTLTGVVGAWVGVTGWRASRSAARAEVRVGLLDAVRAYEAALEPYQKRYLSPGPTIRQGDRELVLENLPALQAARDSLLVALHRAEPDDFRFCRRLAELEIRKFDAGAVLYLVNAAKAARADAVSGGSRPSIPDGDNYEIVSVASVKLLS